MNDFELINSNYKQQTYAAAGGGGGEGRRVMKEELNCKSGIKHIGCQPNPTEPWPISFSFMILCFTSPVHLVGAAIIPSC